MEDEVKKLVEHNAERMAINEMLRKQNEPHPNGIECPYCQSELWDSNPMMILASNAPQKNIHCPKCKYTGYRLA